VLYSLKATDWDDILRLITSLKLGRLNVMSIMKTLQTGDRPISLAQAIAEIGRADKTIHMLTYLDEENKRRRTLQNSTVERVATQWPEMFFMVSGGN
jgi:TnpA family transposase